MKVTLFLAAALIACSIATFIAVDGASRNDRVIPQRTAGDPEVGTDRSETQDDSMSSLGGRSEPVLSTKESVEQGAPKGGDVGLPTSEAVDWREPLEIKYAGWTVDEIRGRRDELAKLHDDGLRDIARVQLEAGNFIEVLGIGMPEAHLIPSPPQGQGIYKVGFDGPASATGATTRWVILFTQDIPQGVLELGRESYFVNQRAQDMGIPSK